MKKVSIQPIDDFNCFELSYGDELAIRIRTNRKALVLAVDVGCDSTKFCYITQGHNSNDSIIESFDGGTFEDISNFVKAILSLSKPKKLYLDSNTYGVGLWDYLLPFLVKNNIYVSQDGEAKYNLSKEEFIKEVSNGNNKIYDRAFKS